MSKRVVLILILALAFLGIADAWYLTQSALSDTPLICDVGGTLDGCNIVAQSPYSSINGIPLALFGVFFFSFIFVLAALALWIPRRVVSRALAILGIVGFLASIVFICIQIFLIKAVCLYCFASAAIAFLIYILTSIYNRQSREPVVQEWEVTRVVS